MIKKVLGVVSYTEIYFNHADGGYELVLQKDKETGEQI